MQPVAATGGVLKRRAPSPLRRAKEIDVGRLCEALNRDRLVLSIPRNNRKEMVRQYVGQHWSENGTTEEVPVNLLALYVDIVGSTLIAQSPRIMLSTFNRAQKPTVYAMQMWVNQQIKRMKAQATLQRIVTDSLFGVGVSKVALATPSDAAVYGWKLKAGQPYLSSVDLDDLVWDSHARSFEELDYVGHRYRVPLETVRDSNLYGKGRKELHASTDPMYNKEGDERISLLGRGWYGANADEFEDWVDLWEIYLPRHNLVVTLADDDVQGMTAKGEAAALRVVSWIGPETGPYKMLGMGIVPGNLMPKAPLQDLFDLHMSTNRHYRKAIRDADMMKVVTGVQAGATEDGKRVMTASHGQMIRLDDPKNIAQIILSGQIAGPLLQTAMQEWEKFNQHAGNMEMIGGLSPQAKTLGQDRMLDANASRVISSKQERVVNFTAEVAEDLNWYWWNDPLSVHQGHLSVPGMPGLDMSLQIFPGGHPDPNQLRRRGTLPDLSVDPYSLQHQTPQSRVQEINEVVTTVVIPMMQILQAQGISFDINEYLTKIGQYRNMPDLADLLTIREPQPMTGSGQEGSGQGTGRAGPQPAQTQRDYVRHNVPQQSNRQSQDRGLMAALGGVNLGGNPNQRNGQVPMPTGR